MRQPTVSLGTRYQIRGALGEGGMGTVYLVEDAETGSTSALKLLGAASPSEIEVLRFKQEFRAMARLRHPNVCEVRDFGQTPEGRPFFTMEVVPGHGLDELRPMDAETLLPLVGQMAAALGYVHAQGYVHGDVKPDNLRVGRVGGHDVLKLMDFGLMVAAGQRHDGIAGTLAYLSPEAAKGDRLDQRSDLYALGAVLYELVTGEQPIRGATPLDVLRGHLREVPPPPRAIAPGVPEALDRAIMKLLAKEPAQRFASAGELLAALGLASQIDEAARLLESPFVGRKPELTHLEAALEALAEGRGAVVRVTGAAGLGKSRLLDELRVRAQLADRPALQAAAAPDDPPFAPFISAMRQALPLARELAPDVLAAEAPALAAALPELANGPVDESENAGAKLQAALARVLAATLARAKGVLLLDNWDQADAASRQTLAFLERNAAAFADTDELPFLLVVAGREPADGADALALAGLAPAETRALLAGLLGQPDAPAGLAEQLQGLTGGTPRMLAGLLAQALAKGAIARADGAWRLPETLPPDAFTTDVRRGLSDRLAGLPEDAHALARVAALLAEPFELPLLSAAGGVPEDLAIDLSEALVRAGLLDGAHGRYRFALAELREILADELAAGDRARIHGLAGAHLQAHPPQGASEAWLANALARHLLAGGPAEAAVDAALAATRRLQVLGGAETVLGFLERALERTGELPDDAATRGRKLDLLLLQAWALTSSYAMVPAAAAIDEVIALAEAAGDTARLARACASKALQLSLLGAPAEQLQAINVRALALAAEAGDHATLARAGSNYGRWQVLQGNVEQGRETLDAALVAARASGLSLYEARALASLGFALGATGKTRDEGIALMREALALQVRQRDRYGEGFTNTLLYGVLSDAGRFEPAADAASAGAAIMRETDTIEDLMLALANEARAATELGDVDRALRAGREALDYARVKQHPIVLGYAGAVVARVRAQLGEADAALPLLDEADGIARGLGGYFLQCILPHVVQGYLATGALGRARTALQEGVFTLRGSGGEVAQAMLATLQAQVYAAEGNWPEAAAQAVEARTVAAKIGAEALQAWAIAISAMACTAQGQPVPALQQADEAQALAGKLGLRPVLALLAGLRGELALAGNPAEAMAHFQAMQVLADALASPLLRAHALHGQVRALPSAPHAASVLDQAQRAIRDLADRLPEDEARLLLASPVVAAVLARNPAIAEAGQTTGGRTHFAEHFARVNGDLQSLFAQYGSLQKDWETSVARLRRLNELASQLGSYLTLEEVLPQVVALTLEITGAERGFVVLKGDDRYGNLVCRAAYDQAGTSLAPTDWSLSICHKVIAAGQAIAILDASADADFQAAKSIVAFNVRTVMGVPMIAKGQLVGVLYVDSSAVVTTFTEADLEMLRGIALHAGVAIENARLYEHLGRHAAELEDALAKYRRAEAEASTDALTGLPNRRKFVDESEREILLARRFGHPLCVCILDVDHFKKFNDTYGHALGDEVLKVVARELAGNVGAGQLPARLGGEEFTILVPAADHAVALATAERVREAIAAVVLNDDKGVPVRQITASFGVALLLPSDKGVGDVLERADAALYAAKHGGRNQTMFWREGMTSHG